MSADLSNSTRPASDTPRPLGEIAQGPGGFELFLDRNQKSLLVLAILIALAAAGFVIYRGVSEGREKSAGAALSKADDLASLQGVLKNHEDTSAAGSAAVLLADRQWTDGDQDAAITTLREFISENPKHPARPTAQASLATKLAAQGNPDEARPLFRSVADDPSASFLAPYALIALGDLERAAGDRHAAESYYQRARNDFPGNNFTESATRRLTVLNAEPPVEIDPPPAPPESADSPPLTVPPMLAPRSTPGLDFGSPFAPPGTADLAPAPDLPEVPPTDGTPPSEIPSEEDSDLPQPPPPVEESPDPNAATGDQEPAADDSAAPAEP